MNRPKNRGKTHVFRIFRQIHAKMGLESQYLCGFPEGTVRMEIARRGHCIASPSLSSGRKGERQMNAMQNKYAKEVNL